jgi:hypothetical protein
VVDKERVVWYENPTWKMRTILQGKTKPDNVCICSLDIDGDGKLDFVLGAGWKPFDTKTPGTLQWLRRKKNLDDEWDMFPISCDEPTVHRLGILDGIYDQPKSFVMAPLMGRDSTKEKNWMDGRPVRIMKYPIPANPSESSNWKPEVMNEELHVVHNLHVHNKGPVVFAQWTVFASYEGLSMWEAGDRKMERIHEGNQRTPNGARGSSEVAFGHDGFSYATIEPWHGHEVIYYPKKDKDELKQRRIVVDNRLRWGHAIRYGWNDENDDQTEDHPIYAVGVRDNPDPKQGDTFTEKRGVRLYRATDAKGEKWERYILEDGGVAVEDLQVADLNGDGKPDIVAVGRATQNCRIYWNQGK